MNNLNKGTRKLVSASVIGAAYAALTVTLAWISYGPIQFRVAEALCVLPFFLPASAWGLFVGCVLANLVGGYGIMDIVFGSLATLLAGLCAARIGKRSLGRLSEGKKVSWRSCAAVCAMPVIFNIPIIGAVLAYSIGEYVFWEGFLLYGAQVGLGEITVMYLLGLPLMRLILDKRDVLERLGAF